VKAENKQVKCKIKGKFRIKGIRTTNPIAVGDWVDFNMLEDQDLGVIYNIHPRKNYIIRKATNLSKQSQIIAANIDQAFLVVTVAFPETLPGFIDRFLVAAEAYSVPVTLLFNKVDLYEETLTEQLNYLKEIYEGAGYACLSVSATEGTNLERLKDLMRDKTNILSGNSGVGKSTLINALDPDLNLKTAQISIHHLKGKHTTTFAEMHELTFGGMIIDTPGVKGFGMLEIAKEELGHFFPEIFKRLEGCKYYNCTHTHEPGCAVKAAVENGEISESRYYNYLAMLNGEDLQGVDYD